MFHFMYCHGFDLPYEVLPFIIRERNLNELPFAEHLPHLWKVGWWGSRAWSASSRASPWLRAFDPSMSPTRRSCYLPSRHYFCGLWHRPSPLPLQIAKIFYLPINSLQNLSKCNLIPFPRRFQFSNDANISCIFGPASGWKAVDELMRNRAQL